MKHEELFFFFSPKSSVTAAPADPSGRLSISPQIETGATFSKIARSTHGITFLIRGWRPSGSD